MPRGVGRKLLCDKELLSMGALRWTGPRLAISFLCEISSNGCSGYLGLNVLGAYEREANAGREVTGMSSHADLVNLIGAGYFHGE